MGDEILISPFENVCNYRMVPVFCLLGDSDVDQCEFGSALPGDEDLFSAKDDSLIKKAFIKRTSDATSRVWMEKDGTTGNGDKLSLHYGVVDTENADDCAAIRQPIFVNCAHGAPCAKDMNRQINLIYMYFHTLYSNAKTS